jgi:hypothetical protein
MNDIQFEEGYNQINNQYYHGSSNERGIAAWLINKGIVKSAKSAQLALLVVAVLCFGLAFYLISGNNQPTSQNETLPPTSPLRTNPQRN